MIVHAGCVDGGKGGALEGERGRLKQQQNTSSPPQEYSGLQLVHPVLVSRI